MASASASTGAEHTVATAYTGSKVLLPCAAPHDLDLENLALEWTRPDLGQQYVFLFRDGRPFLVYQHSQFKGRVELADPTLTSGDLSIRLSDVSQLDEGQYECHIFSQSHVRKRSAYDTEPIRTIELKVTEPQTIRASPGEDVELRLEKPDYPVTSFMWKREDDPEHFVFLFGMGHPHHQSPQYSGRTKLKDQDQLRDLSVILHRVQPSDSGTYHGHIVQSQRRTKRDLDQSELYSVIILKVETSGALRLETAVGLMAAVLVSLLLQIWE